MRRTTWYRGPSASLLVTFMLGVGVGFFLCYAFFDTSSDGSASPPADVETPAPVAATPAPAEGEQIPVPAPVAELIPSPADLEASWPMRHLVIGFEGTAPSRETLEVINTWKPAGLWLRESNTANAAQVGELIALLNRYASVGAGADKNPLIFMAQEGGPGKNPLRLEAALSNQDLAALESLEDIRKAGKATAREALKAGVTVLLAPMMDIFVPGQTRDSDRPFYFSDNQQSVIQAGLAYAGGLMEGGIITIARNYPGMGGAIYKQGDIPLIAETDVSKLAEIMLPFAEAAAYDISGILVGAVAVPTLDKEMPGRPASISPILVREVLRRQFGYTGAALASDILEIAPWSGNTPEKDIVAALAAGCDAVFISSVNAETMGFIAQEIKTAVEKGVLKKDELEASARRLDAWRQRAARNMDSLSEGAAKEGESPETALSPETTPVPVMDQSANPVMETLPVEGEQKPSEALVPEKSPEQIVEPAPVEAPAETAPSPAPGNPEPEAKPVESTEQSAPPPGSKRITYTIRQGDNLSKVGRLHNVSAADIMKWNDMKGPEIKFGKELVLYVPESFSLPETMEKVEEEAPSPAPAAAVQPATETLPPAPPEVSTPPVEPVPPIVPTAPVPAVDTPPAPTPPAEQAPAPEADGKETVAPPQNEASVPVEQAEPVPVPAAPAPVTEPSPVTPAPEPAPDAAQPLPSAEASPAPPVGLVPYTIQTGDTLNSIANRHNTTVQNLIKINGMTDPNVIVVGQDIKVPAI